ncbi:MAG: PQQ-binding-like beta-propeller repeat protein [Sandaracinus sp.]
MRLDGRGAQRRAIAMSGGLALAALGAIEARAERAEPGHLVTLRSDLASSVAVDLGGPQREGHLDRSLTNAPLSVVTRVPITSRRATAPVEWREGTLAIGTAEGLLVYRDGAVVRVATGPVDARPVVLPSGELVVATREGRVLVIDPQLAIQREARASSGISRGPLVLADGSIVVASNDRMITRFDADLERVFATTLTTGLPLSPALRGASRIVVVAGERLYELDLSGQILSSLDLGERAASAPLVDDQGHVHLATVGGTILVVAHARHVVQRISVGGRLLDQNVVLARDTDGSYRLAVPTLGVLAIERDGEPRWSATTDAPFPGPLAIAADHRTIAFDRRGRIVVLSPSGEIQERLELGGLVNGFPQITRDGTLWATTDAGELVHVAPAPRPAPAPVVAPTP